MNAILEQLIPRLEKVINKQIVIRTGDLELLPKGTDSLTRFIEDINNLNFKKLEQKHFELYIESEDQLSEMEKNLITAWIDFELNQTEISEKQLLLDENGYKSFNKAITFPLRLWSIQFKDNMEDVEEIIVSAFEGAIRVQVSSNEIVVFVTSSELSPYDLMDMLEAEALTKSKVTVSSQLTQSHEIYKGYQQILELIQIGNQLNNNYPVIIYDRMILPYLIYNLKHPVMEMISAPHMILEYVIKDQIQSIGDEELEQTALSFFENNLNITETASKLFIHRNTLIYRLNKLEAITGYDIRKFKDAMNFYVNYLIEKIL